MGAAAQDLWNLIETDRESALTIPPGQSFRRLVQRPEIRDFSTPVPANQDP